MNEKDLQIQICQYIKLQYPSVIFFSEPSGLYLKSWNQRKQLRAMRSFGKLPDLFVARPKVNVDGSVFHGLFIELKVDSVWKKDGTLMKNPHLEKQSATLKRLYDCGYYAVFGCGFEETKNIIDNYLK